MGMVQRTNPHWKSQLTIVTRATGRKCTAVGHQLSLNQYHCILSLIACMLILYCMLLGFGQAESDAEVNLPFKEKRAQNSTVFPI